MHDRCSKLAGYAGEELEPETEGEWKTLKFPVPSLSALSFGGEAATLAGEAELALTSHEFWRASNKTFAAERGGSMVKHMMRVGV